MFAARRKIELPAEARDTPMHLYLDAVDGTTRGDWPLRLSGARSGFLRSA